MQILIVIYHCVGMSEYALTELDPAAVAVLQGRSLAAERKEIHGRYVASFVGTYAQAITDLASSGTVKGEALPLKYFLRRRVMMASTNGREPLTLAGRQPEPFRVSCEGAFRGRGAI